MLGNELLQGRLVYLTAYTKDIHEKLHPLGESIEHLRQSAAKVAFPRPLDKQWESIDSARKDDHAFRFAIYTLDGDTLLGQIGIKDINWQMRHGDVGMGMGIVDPAQRGKGYGADALRVLLKYSFMELNLNRVGLQVVSFNQAAIAMYKKVGFQHEATLRQAMYRDLEYHDIHIMSILYREWQTLYGGA